MPHPTSSHRAPAGTPSRGEELGRDGAAPPPDIGLVEVAGRPEVGASSGLLAGLPRRCHRASPGTRHRPPRAWQRSGNARQHAVRRQRETPAWRCQSARPELAQATASARNRIAVRQRHRGDGAQRCRVLGRIAAADVVVAAARDRRRPPADRRSRPCCGARRRPGSPPRPRPAPSPPGPTARRRRPAPRRQRCRAPHGRCCGSGGSRRCRRARNWTSRSPRRRAPSRPDRAAARRGRRAAGAPSSGNGRHRRSGRSRRRSCHRNARSRRADAGERCSSRRLPIAWRCPPLGPQHQGGGPSREGRREALRGVAALHRSRPRPPCRPPRPPTQPRAGSRRRPRTGRA